MLRQFNITEMFRNDQLKSMDMVVMGSNGAQGMRAMVGSNTQRVVRIAPMPVLVIKHIVEDFDVQDLVYASNFTPADIKKFDAFLPIVKLFDPKVHLLKVNTPGSFQRSADSYKAIDAFLQRHELRKFSTTIYNDLSVEEGILDFARGIDADMIAMATHGRKDSSMWSITEDIVNHTSFPVLSVKPETSSRQRYGARPYISGTNHQAHEVPVQEIPGQERGDHRAGPKLARPCEIHDRSGVQEVHRQQNAHVLQRPRGRRRDPFHPSLRQHLACCGGKGE
jgi:nucleotide-binding universal stress UspA family protein